MNQRFDQPFATRRPASGKLVATIAAALVSWPGLALAQDAAEQPAATPASGTEPTREQCLDAHREAQELKKNGKFLEANEHLLICSAGSCPGAIISDCGNWITQLEQLTPSMVFEIKLDGKQALDAKLFVNDRPIDDLSQAVKVNPGRHTVRVELPPFPPREEQVVLPEGQRMRLISVEFESEKPALVDQGAVAPPPKEYERPVPFIFYPLLIAGVGGLASFGVFSYLGKEEQDKLEAACEPLCTDDDLETMKKNYLVADISAGVGVAALLGASIVYLTRPRVEVVSSSKTAPRPALGPLDVRVGASSFGVSMTRRW